MNWHTLNLFIPFILIYAGLILLYILIANRFQLTDTPSERSSHKKSTVTGAGFIFPLAFFLALVLTGEYIFYRSCLVGLLLI